jgi:hypothetical protein
MTRSLLILSAVLAMGTTLTCTAQLNRSWPHIEAFDRKYVFESQDEIYLRFSILDLNRKIAYLVECANPLARDARVNSEGHDWSGDFECRVAKPGARFLPAVQLLAESTHVTSFWETRARFWWQELTPDCIDFPDWGGTRVFRLRHMRLTIQITNPKIVPPSPDSHESIVHALRGLNVEISGRYDRNANRSVAEMTSIAEPPPLDPDKPDGPLQCGSATK